MRSYFSLNKNKRGERIKLWPGGKWRNNEVKAAVNKIIPRSPFFFLYSKILLQKKKKCGLMSASVK